MRRNAAYAQQLEESQIRAVARCCAVAGAVVAVGALGFRMIEGWDLWEATYFTLVTITTVGYGDNGLSPNGKIFASFLLLCGIGTFTYSLSTLVQIASDVDALLRRRMKKQIAECSGHVVVCGYGRIGRMICDEIERDGRRCVVVEQDGGCVQRAIADGRLVVAGTASDDDVLLAAGIERAEAIVCAVDSDAENLFITVSARELAPHCRVISRAESPAAARKLERAGAMLVVSPHLMAGKTIATALVHPRLTKFLHCSARTEDASSYFELGEVVIEAGSSAEGRTIRELGQELEGVVFVAVERDEDQLLMRPGGDHELRPGEVVIFAGAGDVVQQMRRRAENAAAGEALAV